MAGKWVIAKMNDVANVTDYVANGSFASLRENVTYLSNPNHAVLVRLVDHNARWSGDFVYVDKPSYEFLHKSALVPGDVVIANVGANAGTVFRVPDLGRPMTLGPNAVLCSPKNEQELLREYLYYYLISETGQESLQSILSGSAQPKFNKTDLRRVSLPIPSPSEQRAIAHILGTLDDKIELNRRMSETLEAMARTLFKSWFVDFDPVRAKMEKRWHSGQSLPGLPADLYNLFPDRLVDSELGEIPEGWHIGTFDKVVTQYKESVTPSEFADREFVHFSLPAFDEGRTPQVESGEAIKSNKWRVVRDSVLLSKLNPEIDRTWVVDVEDNQLTICSTEFLVLMATKPFTRAYVYCLARSLSFRQQLESMVTGTSKSHQRVQPTALMELSVLIPNAHVLTAFDTAVSALLARMLIMRRESQTLSSIRDTLLPKLISGELCVRSKEALLMLPP